MRSILVIEDEIDLSECLVAILSDANWNVETAKNGVEAFAILTKTKIDIILSDIDMPIMNGIDFLKAFRSQNNSTPVVMMSAGLNYSKDQLVNLGANDFIEKPFKDISQIIKKNAA